MEEFSCQLIISFSKVFIKRGIQCRAMQYRWVIVKSSDKTWSTEEENDNPIQYSCLQNTISSVQFSSVTQSCPTLSDNMNCSTPGSLSITNPRGMLKLMSIVSVKPCNHLILCCPLLFLPSIFPNIRGFFNESALPIRWPKYWSFSFSISPSNDYSGLSSFRIDCLVFWQKNRS